MGSLEFPADINSRLLESSIATTPTTKNSKQK